MLKFISIQNYKSIVDIKLEVGRFNVIIGENGAGKSNFLEALAAFGAIEADKFDNEFLFARGIRNSNVKLMESRFDQSSMNSIISVAYDGFDEICSANLNIDTQTYPKYMSSYFIGSKQRIDFDAENAKILNKEELAKLLSQPTQL